MNYLITLSDNKKRSFFLKLIKQLDFIEEIQETNLSLAQLRFINDFEESIKYIKQDVQDKQSFKTAQQLIDEL